MSPSIEIEVPVVAPGELPLAPSITSASEASAAAEALRVVAGRRSAIVAAFAPAKKAAHAAHAQICALEKEALAPCDAARDAIQREVLRWQVQERARIEAEQAAAQAAAAQAAAEAAAQAALDGADEAAIAAAEADAILATVAPVPMAPAKLAGVSTRTTWRAEVTDLLALAAYVVAHPEWAGLLAANQSACDALARSQKGTLALPGLRAVAVESLSVRGAS